MLYLNSYLGFYAGPGFFTPDLRIAQPFDTFLDVERAAKAEGLVYWCAMTPAGEEHRRKVEQARGEIRTQWWGKRRKVA
jgi:hypothetical protein